MVRPSNKQGRPRQEDLSAKEYEEQEEHQSHLCEEEEDDDDDVHNDCQDSSLLPCSSRRKRSVHDTARASLASTTTTELAAVQELQSAHLLSLQMQELLAQCRLSSSSSSSPLDAHQRPPPRPRLRVVWASALHAYLSHLAPLVASVPLTMTTASSPSTSSPVTPTTALQLILPDEAALLPPSLADLAAAGGKSRSQNMAQAVLSTLTVGGTPSRGNAQVTPTFQAVVQIPNAFWHPKDYHKGKYLQKRNQCVYQVAQLLSQSKHRSMVGEVHVQFLEADPRKPCLCLRPPIHPKRAASPFRPTAPFRVRLIFQMESLHWVSSPLRWLPNRCNLPATSASSTSNSSLRPTTTNSAMAPTPHYNHILLEDAQYYLAQQALSSRQSRRHHDGGDDEPVDTMDDEIIWYAHVQDAIILVKVWCLQRGLLRNHDGIDTPQIFWLFLYLYRTRQVNARMSMQQLLAAWFKLWAETDWWGATDHHHRRPSQSREPAKRQGQNSPNNKIRFAASEATADGYVTGDRSRERQVLVLPWPHETVQQTVASSSLAQLYEKQTRESPLTPHDPPTLIELYRSDPNLVAVFLDPTLTYNYLGRLSPSYLRSIQSEAQNCLKQLYHSSAIRQAESFTYLFMSPVRFWDRFDAYVPIPLTSIRFGRSTLWGLDRHDLGDYESFARGLIEVLSRALGDRVTNLRLLSTGNGPAKRNDSSTKDSDETPFWKIQRAQVDASDCMTSPTGVSVAVLGIAINPETCDRLVDRGPPADDALATEKFLELWGPEKAGLRRFKDGAIVHAVVWDHPSAEKEGLGGVLFQNEDKMQGGIVERVVQHILKLHFLDLEQRKEDTSEMCRFALRNMLSCVDSFRRVESQKFDFNPAAAHRQVTRAFDALSRFLRENSIPSLSVPGTNEKKSPLGIPLAIDAVEPLAPALRHASLFPPIPFPHLGGPNIPGLDKCSSVVMSDPIEIQIRFGASSSWPQNLRALGAAKTAMLIELANGIEAMKRNTSECDDFEGTVVLTPTYADLLFRGYVFRLFVRADQEVALLQRLSNPVPVAAAALTRLIRKHVVGAKHHTLVQSVYTSHPSSSYAVRLASRWVSCHLLAGHIPFEAVELMVVGVYSGMSTPLGPPATAIAGFLRFLKLLAFHEWARTPLIVDPQGHFSDDDYVLISKAFEDVRGAAFEQGPPMYIVSPSDRIDVNMAAEAQVTTHSRGVSIWQPCVTASKPERVVLTRACALAERSFNFLKRALASFDATSWPSVFIEAQAAFRSYSALFRVDPDFVVDLESSSTGGELSLGNLNETLYSRSMQQRLEGPKCLRRKRYRNLVDHKTESALLEWRPVDATVEALRSSLGSWALFFYNDLSPAVIGVLWRPLFSPIPFSAMSSEFTRPLVDENRSTENFTNVTLNIWDMIREAEQFTEHLVLETKVFDQGTDGGNHKRKRPAISAEREDDDDSEK